MYLSQDGQSAFGTGVCDAQSRVERPWTWQIAGVPEGDALAARPGRLSCLQPVVREDNSYKADTLYEQTAERTLTSLSSKHSVVSDVEPRGVL